MDFGANMNRPVLVVSLTIQSPARCHLRGYPIIATAARRGYTHEKSRSLDITLRRGSIYERHDPGPRRVELEPHSKAFFGLGTGTGWSPQVYEITRVAITPPGSHESLRWSCPVCDRTGPTSRRDHRHQLTANPA